MKCSDCRYYSEGLCYRYPPRKGKHAIAEYPKVSKWCGEWDSGVETEPDLLEVVEFVDELLAEEKLAAEEPEVEKSWVDAFKEWISFD